MQNMVTEPNILCIA